MAQNFRTKTVRVFNSSIKNETQEQELEIPILPFELYQTTMVQACSLENQLANRSFKFVQISILARAVRHCILQGLSQRGSQEDFSIISREFDTGLDGVGNAHSLCHLMQPGQGLFSYVSFTGPPIFNEMRAPGAQKKMKIYFESSENSAFGAV